MTRLRSPKRCLVTGLLVTLVVFLAAARLPSKPGVCSSVQTLVVAAPVRVPCSVTPNSAQPGTTSQVTITVGPPSPADPLYDMFFFLLTPQEFVNGTTISFQPSDIQTRPLQFDFGAAPAYRYTAQLTIPAGPAFGRLDMTVVVVFGMDRLEMSCQQAFAVTLSAQNGGTVTDPRTRAAATVPGNTLKADVAARVLTLDSSRIMSQANPKCDVPFFPGDTFPAVSGFERATEVVRYEVDPCGSLAFAPGMELKLPLVRAFQGRITSATKLRLFQLGRSETGALVFRDTGIGMTLAPGNFVIADDVQPFGTYAGFVAATTGVNTAKSEDVESTVLYFPAVINDLAARRTTRLSFANPDPSKQLKVSLTAYDGMGAKAGPVELSPLAARGHTSVAVASLFPNLASATIVARVISGTMVGLVEIADDFANPTSWASAEAIRMPQSSLVFPVIEASDTSFTEFHVFNPSCSADAKPVELKLQAFKREGTPVNLLGSTQTFLLLPCRRFLIASRNAPVAMPDLVLPDELDGGYLSIHSSDRQQPLVGTELFGQIVSRKVNLAMLNGLSLPSGCLVTDATRAGCQVDTSPQSPVPDAARQHTLYAAYFESTPATAEVIVVNTSTDVARVAFSVFGEDGRFRATNPTTDPPLFMALAPNQVLKTSVSSLFKFNPAPGYVRVEDPDSALVGVVVNRDGEKYRTALGLVPDLPELAQPNSQSFISRIRLDPTTANPRITTGLIIFNPNNNPVPFSLKVTAKDGTVKTSAQTAASRGMFTRARLSLSTLFADSRDGFVEVMATSKLNPGETGRLIIIGVYRATTPAGIQTTSVVGEQSSLSGGARAP